MSKPIDELKNRLKRALTIRELKPIDLVERTGISKSAISQYMSGYTKPKQDRIYLIANALDVSEAWLMGFDVPMERAENNCSTIIPLDKNESTLISLYRQLNNKGQNILIDTADTLVSSKKYKECNTIQNEKQA